MRPSLANWLGVMAPLLLFATPLTDAVAQRPVLAVGVTAPLTAVLIPLLVAAYMVGHLIAYAAGPTWNSGGMSIPMRIGRSDAWALMNLSPVIAVPISVLLASYASISLTRRSAYPLSRQQMARVEFWGSLAENLVICGLLTALLIGYWSLVCGRVGLTGMRAWPGRAGGYGGWIPFLLRPMGIIFFLIPITQFSRLRYLRAGNGWSSVRQLLGLLGLMFFLTTWAVVVGPRTLAFIPTMSLFVDGPLLVAMFVVTQVAYRHMVDRYFATADLV